MSTLFELAEQPAEYLVPLIRKGLPASSLQEMAAVLGVSKGLLAEKLRIAKRTLTRKESKRQALSSEESEKLLRTARIHTLARSLFTSNAALSLWLSTPDSALGGKSPLDLLDTDIGAREVEDLVQSISYGQFV